MNKPNISTERILDYVKGAGLDIAVEKTVLVGLRNGAVGQHVGIFDDALCWVTAEQSTVFNGNTDPTREFPHVANLKAGIWHYQPGTHHGMSGLPPYPAYVQAADVTVRRYVDGKTWHDDTGQFGIHIHHGGLGTSSLGCQTVPLDQWKAFKALGDALLHHMSLTKFKYLLVEGVAL